MLAGETARSCLARPHDWPPAALAGRLLLISSRRAKEIRPFSFTTCSCSETHAIQVDALVGHAARLQYRPQNRSVLLERQTLAQTPRVISTAPRASACALLSSCPRHRCRHRQMLSVRRSPTAVRWSTLTARGPAALISAVRKTRTARQPSPSRARACHVRPSTSPDRYGRTVTLGDGADGADVC